MLRRRQTLVDPKRPDVKVHKIKHRQTPSVVSVTSRPPHPDDEHPHDDLLNTAGDDDDKPSSPNVGQSTSAKSTMRAKSILSLATLPLRNGHVFALCVLLVFMQAGFYTGRVDKEEQLLLVTPEIQEALKQPLEVLTGRRSRGVIDGEHPIPQLMEEAEARFRRKVGRQSKTLKSAVAEYRKRYGRPAPKGFDKWWAFVQRHEVRMVDEYDGLMSDLEPFWKLSPTELKRRTMQAAELPFVDLVRVRDGETDSVNLRGEGVGGRAEGFRLMLHRFASELPDLDFPINTQSENRVLVPWEHLTYPNLTVEDSSSGLSSVLGESFRTDWAGEGNTWESWRRTCHPDSVSRRIFSSIRNAFRVQNINYFEQDGSPGDDFAFTPAPASELDFCNHPNAHYEQGHFFTDFRPVTALYPIFSPAKAQGFLDIRIPSHYYYGNTPRYTYGWDSVNLEMKDTDAMELPWEKKADKVFWRGASTGGGSHPPGFSAHFHRHRFLQMTSDTSPLNNRTVTFANPPDSGNYVTATVPVEKLNEEVMDTAFVRAVSGHTYPGGEKALRENHRFSDAVPLGRHWAYKYLVDLDGVGYSGRFMSFLASDSVPVKATVYKEFFSDWLEPWLHYIPVSSTYKELYNIHAYFSGPTRSALENIGSAKADENLDERRPMEGDRRLRRIARAGKEWKRTTGRPVDMEAYVYRLCLEWARLLNENRVSMNY